MRLQFQLSRNNEDANAALKHVDIQLTARGALNMFSKEELEGIQHLFLHEKYRVEMLLATYENNTIPEVWVNNINFIDDILKKIKKELKNG